MELYGFIINIKLLLHIFFHGINKAGIVRVKMKFLCCFLAIYLSILQKSVSFILEGRYIFYLFTFW